MELLERLRPFGAAMVSDALGGMGLLERLDPALRPVLPGMRLMGTAVTLKGDHWDGPPPEYFAHLPEALEQGRQTPAPVLVVEMPTCETAVWGGGGSTIAMHHGFVGAVVEGAARDLPELRDLGFPVFARAVTPHDRWGLVQTVSCQEPVIIGGVVVRPGDVLVGDDDGLVVVPAHALAEVVARAEQMAAAERAILEKCRAGVPYVEALRSGPQWWREGHEAKE